MKDYIKRILKKIKLLHFFQRIKRKVYPNAFDKKYGSRVLYALNTGGISIKYHTDDSYSKSWFFPRYDYGLIHEPVTTGIFIQQIRSSDCVFDIGANLGYFTCLAGKLAHQGSVHAFEVDEACVPLIKRNKDLNLLKNVFINNYAVSNHAQTEKIPVLLNPSPGLKLAPADTNMLCKEVQALRLDDYVKEKNVQASFIKIDVEGAEWKVLQGMPHILSQSKLKMLIEIHVDILKEHFDTDYRDILKYLLRLGFVIKEIESHRSEQSGLQEVNESTVLEGNTMLYCEK